jgi:hypothetical protein
MIFELIRGRGQKESASQNKKFEKPQKNSKTSKVNLTQGERKNQVVCSRLL